MRIEDKAIFKETLDAVFVGIGRKPLQGMALKLWWGAFESDPIEDVLEALAVTFKSSTEFLTPGLVRSYMPDRSGFLKPEEAWNRYPKTEFDAGWVYAEMLKAGSSAMDSIDRGDMIAARVAYLESYKAIIEEAKRNKESPKWFYSDATQGSKEDRDGKKIKLTLQAEEMKWIGKAQAQKALLGLEKSSEMPARISKYVEKVFKRMPPPEQITSTSETNEH